MGENLLVTEEDLKELEHYKEDVLFYEKKEEELKKKYPDQWVAIFDKEVVGIDKNLDSLIKSLEAKDISARRTFIEFLSTKEKIMILFVS